MRARRPLFEFTIFVLLNVFDDEPLIGRITILGHGANPLFGIGVKFNVPEIRPVVLKPGMMFPLFHLLANPHVVNRDLEFRHGNGLPSPRRLAIDRPRQAYYFTFGDKNNLLISRDCFYLYLPNRNNRKNYTLSAVLVAVTEITGEAGT